MYFLYITYGLALCGMLVGGMVEQRRHEASLRSIPIRIMVNGIRGKSSVTRLVAGALRGGDVATVAKTTGSAARLISVDGHEVAVFRKFDLANVAEQIPVVRRAASEHPEALVIECMAVEPALQEVSQRKLIQSTVGVITNVREDHLAEMGPSLEEVARSLSLTMPADGVCVTAETALGWVLQDEAAKRRCRLVVADPEGVSDAEMDGFSSFTFKENVAIALAVATEVGVSREAALAGMYAAAPDPGVLRVDRYTIGDRAMRFANIFAANDPMSTMMNVEHLIAEQQIQVPLTVLINCRPDRVERNRQMGQLVGDLHAQTVVVVGHPSRSAIEMIPSSFTGTLIDMGGDGVDPDDVVRTLLSDEDRMDIDVIAIGNIHGMGDKILEYLDELAVLR